MKKQVWHSGPPPSVGWWPASAIGDKNSLRWWNGEYWSFNAYRSNSAFAAAAYASKPASWPNYKIQWMDRPKNWPARSRT